MKQQTINLNVLILFKHKGHLVPWCSGAYCTTHNIFWVQFSPSCPHFSFYPTHIITTRYVGVSIVMPHQNKMCYSWNLYVAHYTCWLCLCFKWPGNSNKYLKVALVPTRLVQSVSQVLVCPYCLKHMGSCLGLPCWLADNKSLDTVVNDRGQLRDNTVPMIKIPFWLPWDQMLIISWVIGLRLCHKYKQILSSCNNKCCNTSAVPAIFFPLYF